MKSRLQPKRKDDILIMEKRPLKVLELFSGTECISNAFRRKGHQCYTVDWDEQFPSNLHRDINDLTAKDILDAFGKPDIVFLGTDCTCYSVAAIGRHRKKDPETGNLIPVTEKAKKADELNVHCKELIKELGAEVQIWENPRGGVEKDVVYAGFNKADNYILSIWFYIYETHRFLQQYRFTFKTTMQER